MLPRSGLYRADDIEFEVNEGCEGAASGCGGGECREGNRPARRFFGEDFGRAMAGDAIEHATKALLEELVGFSPSPRDRANLQRILATTWNVMDKARDVIEARLATVDTEALVAQALATSGSSSGAAPASSASSPAD